MSLLAKGAVCAVAFALSACVGGGGEDDTTSEPSDEGPSISVTVPIERLTPFCQAMIELGEELLQDGVGDATPTIIEAYRSVAADVPAEIADDFDAVLSALERGAPPPTDPPVITVASTAPVAAVTTVPRSETVPPPTDATGSTIASAGDEFFDEGYGPGTSPAERVNEYVLFACRDTENNPGPPATQPLDDPGEESADE